MVLSFLSISAKRFLFDSEALAKVDVDGLHVGVASETNIFNSREAAEKKR
jgi:hypothetical protein